MTEVGDSRFTTSSAPWFSLSSRFFYLIAFGFVALILFVAVDYIFCSGVSDDGSLKVFFAFNENDFKIFA